MLTHASSLARDNTLTYTKYRKIEGQTNIYMQMVKTLMNLASTCDFFLPINNTCVLGAQKNHLNEMVLLITHNICFV